MKTAAKSTPNTNTSVSRPKSGESRRRRFTFVVNSKECFCLRMRTFGPMSQPWIKDTTTNRSTSVSFVRTIGGQKESGTEKSMTLPRRTAPVTTKRNRAPQLSLRNRRASFTNPLCAERESESCFRRGTTTSERNNMPPTQNVAATRWTQARIIAGNFTSGIVAGLSDTHHNMRYSIRGKGAYKSS